MKEQQEETRVKEVYHRDKKPIEAPDDSLMLTKREIISSLAGNLDRIAFSKHDGTEVTYPASIKEYAEKIIVELEDGSVFEVMIGEIRHE